MSLISQKMRTLAPEMDPLRIGTGWSLKIFPSRRFLSRAHSATHIPAAATWTSWWKKSGKV